MLEGGAASVMGSKPGNIQTLGGHSACVEHAISTAGGVTSSIKWMVFLNKKERWLWKALHSHSAKNVQEVLTC